MPLERQPDASAYESFRVRHQLKMLLSGEGFRTSHFVPGHFEKYCKIFHPIYRDPTVKDSRLSWDENAREPLPDEPGETDRMLYDILGESAALDGDLSARGEPQRVSWSDLAARLGKKFHPGFTQSMFFEEGWPKSLVYPDEGMMDPMTFERLLSFLKQITGSERCHFFYSWVALPDHAAPGAVFRGSLDAFTKFIRSCEDPRNCGCTPAYWWDSDESWTVFTEEDSAFTVVGGPERLILDLLDDRELEAVIVQPDTRLWGAPEEPPRPQGL